MLRRFILRCVQIFLQNARRDTSSRHFWLVWLHFSDRFICEDRPLIPNTYARELISVSIRYSQGGGFNNTSLSRFMYCNHASLPGCVTYCPFVEDRPSRHSSPVTATAAFQQAIQVQAYNYFFHAVGRDRAGALVIARYRSSRRQRAVLIELHALVI